MSLGLGLKPRRIVVKLFATAAVGVVAAVGTGTSLFTMVLAATAEGSVE